MEPFVIIWPTCIVIFAHCVIIHNLLCNIRYSCVIYVLRQMTSSWQLYFVNKDLCFVLTWCAPYTHNVFQTRSQIAKLTEEKNAAIQKNLMLQLELVKFLDTFPFLLVQYLVHKYAMISILIPQLKQDQGFCHMSICKLNKHVYYLDLSGEGKEIFCEK